MNLEDFKSKLSQKWLLDSNDLEKKFWELAEFLLNHVSIQKGERKYWMTDIELYLYAPNHKDIITYPRDCKAGQWFFHPSGVDISFESKVNMKVKPSTKRAMPYLTESSIFGGILIRGIKLAGGEHTINEETRCFNGPMIVCGELFDMFDAFGEIKNFPKLQMNEHCNHNVINSSPRARLKRKDKTIKQKVDSILINNYSGNDIEKDLLYEGFKNYLDSKYRFYL